MGAGGIVSDASPSRESVGLGLVRCGDPGICLGLHGAFWRTEGFAVVSVATLFVVVAVAILFVVVALTPAEEACGRRAVHGWQRPVRRGAVKQAAPVSKRGPPVPVKAPPRGQVRWCCGKNLDGTPCLVNGRRCGAADSNLAPCCIPNCFDMVCQEHVIYRARFTEFGDDMPASVPSPPGWVPRALMATCPCHCPFARLGQIVE